MMAHWRLSAWYFAYFAFIGAFLPYFGLYLDSLGLSPARIGILMSLGQIMRMLVPALWGWVSDRSGRRTPMVRLSAALSVLCFGAYFLTTEFLSLMVVTVLLHLFWSGALPLVEALTFAHLSVAPERYGRIRLWGSVGFIVAVLGVGLILDHAPIAALLWCGWLLLALVMLVAWSLQEAPGERHGGVVATLGSLRERRVLTLLVAGFFMSAAHGPLYVFFSIHLVGNGYGKAVTGMLWSSGVLAEIVIFLLMPRLNRLFSLKSMLVACFVLAVVRFVLIGWWVDVVWLVMLAQLMHAATFGVHHVATVAALNQWFSSGQQGRIQALYGSLSFGAGGMLGALLAGQVWQSHGAGPSYGMAAGFALLGLLVVLVGLPGATTGASAVR